MRAHRGRAATRTWAESLFTRTSSSSSRCTSSAAPSPPPPRFPCTCHSQHLDGEKCTAVRLLYGALGTSGLDLKLLELCKCIMGPGLLCSKLLFELGLSLFNIYLRAGGT